jgi:2-isopropylmalate synthase
MIVSNSSNGSNSKTSLMDSPFKLLAGQVTINEETLRDGEQTAGVTFLKEDKVAIAQLLAQALPGAILNAGYPPISRAEWEAVNAVAQATEGAQVECAGRCTREDFKLCYTAVSPAQFPRVSFWFPSSPLMLASRFGISADEMLARALDVLAFGRDLTKGQVGLDVALADASRADMSFLVEACGRLHEAGADTLVICDTVGRMLPHEVTPFVRELVTAVPDGGIIFHGHHDLGHGTANALLALQAGAKGVATAVNGLGERAGMPPTEELIASLILRPDALPGRELHADSTKLLPLSRLVAERSGIYPHDNKPVVGSSVLRRETGTQVDWMQREVSTFQIVSPEFLGAEGIELVVGKMSSHGSLRLALAQKGYVVTDPELSYIFTAIKELTGRQRHIADEDIAELVAAAQAETAL